MKFSNRQIQGLCQQYHDLLATREARGDRLRAIREGTYDLEEQSLAGAGDPKALAASRKEEVDLQRDVEAADRSLAKLQQQLTAAIGAEVLHQVGTLPALRQEADNLRLAAAGLIGKCLALLRFLQSPRGVFAPDELLAVAVGPLAGRKSEPPHYVDALAAVEASAGPELAALPGQFPELGSFQSLVQKIRFLEGWAEPQPPTAESPAALAAVQNIQRITNRQKHLDRLVLQAIGGSRKEKKCLKS